MSKFFPSLSFGLGKGPASAPIAVSGPPTEFAQGTLALCMDPAQGLTMGTGVAEWASLVGGWTYSQASGALQPSTSTLADLPSIYSDGTQFLTKDQDSLIVEATDKFLFGLVYKCDTIQTDYDGIWGDGTTTDTVIKFGRSAVSTYNRIFFGTHDDRFVRVRFDDGGTNANGDFQTLIATYDGVNNNASGWTGKINNVASSVEAAGGFGPATEKGGLFNYQGAAYCLNGHIGYLFIIKDYTASDLSNSVQFLSQWGTY